jgi:hypothetical protein
LTTDLQLRELGYESTNDSFNFNNNAGTNFTLWAKESTGVAYDNAVTLSSTVAIVGVLTATAASVFNGGLASNGNVTVTSGDLTVGGHADIGKNVSMSLVSTGHINLRLGILAATPSNASDGYIGVHNTGGPGQVAGDLLLIPRTSVGAGIRMFTGLTTPVERLSINSDGNVEVIAGDLDITAGDLTLTNGVLKVVDNILSGSGTLQDVTNRIENHGNLAVYTSTADGDEKRAVIVAGGASDPGRFRLYDGTETLQIELIAGGTSTFTSGDLGITAGDVAVAAGIVSVTEEVDTDYATISSNISTTNATVTVNNSEDDTATDNRFALMSFSSASGTNADGYTVIGNVSTGDRQGNFIVATRGGSGDPNVTEKFRVGFDGDVEVVLGDLALSTVGKKVIVVNTGGQGEFYGSGSDTVLNTTTDNLILAVEGTAKVTAASGSVTIGATTGLITAATTTTRSGFNLPHGTAPSSPNNGDLWTTTTGVFARVSGTSYQMPVVTAGGATIDLDQAASPTDTTWYWTKSDDQVTITPVSNASATSTATTTFTLSGIPANLRPTTVSVNVYIHVFNDTAKEFAKMTINTDGTATISRWDGSDFSSNSFTTSSLRGLYQMPAFTYKIL